MKRSLFIVIGVAALAGALFAAAFLVTNHLCAGNSPKTDDLAWLREEFHLNVDEMARIRKLHDGYLPKCAEMCARIAAKKAELDSALNGATGVSPAVEAKLAELGQLRAQCQAQMLRHFAEVSEAMPPEQGRRYLAEMRRLTLGSHDQVEQSMSGSMGHEHGPN
jgi:hypothetical protein